MSEADLTLADADPVGPDNVGKSFIAGLALANLGVWSAFFGPLQVLLAIQVTAIGQLPKEQTLGWITGAGAMVAMLVNPLAGAASDRTRSQWGRRVPWMVCGTLAGASCLIALGQLRTVLGLALGWCAAQAALNVVLAALNAEIPDRVPEAKRGLCGGWVGVMQPGGVLVGATLATLGSPATGYLWVAGALIVCVLPFPWLAARTPVPYPVSEAPTAKAGGRVLCSHWSEPLRTPDFAWAWCMRFMVNLGNAVGTLYLLYFLEDRVRYSALFPGQTPQQGLLILTALYAGGVVIGALAAGMVSDRCGRRKPVIFAAAVLVVAGLCMLAVVVDWRWVKLAAALEGLGFGGYVAIDIALVTQVLPRAQHRGRDLGLVNIANAAPQVVGPAVAAVLVTQLGGYPVLFVFAALVTFVGALAASRVRSVR